ncbi:MAG TPA: dihydropteroate synthase DHPS, partial [Candidatus Hydrogenedentes bacterium]|nr:dihydropteroate synthase DHPS [Candidatus Hydrogenedentota bacterium]
VSKPNRTAEEVHLTANRLVAIARDRAGLENTRCIIDPGIAPVGSDTEGFLKMVLGAIRLIHDDPGLAGVHMSVGLSNFTVMLPPKCADGSPVKSALESAFLTLAVPLGLDMVIGSVKRKYELLPEDHPAMQCLRDVLELEGYDAVMRVMQFYS